MSGPEQETARKRLLYLVTEDWAFQLHRLPMARAAMDAGFEVHVATRVVRHREAIRAEGVIVHDLPWRRGNMSPFEVIRMCIRIRRLCRQIRPDLMHHVALQPAIIGSLAMLGTRVPSVISVNGLGFAFSSPRLRARTARALLTLLMRLLFNRGANVVVVQNPDDRRLLEAIGVEGHRLATIPGSGVDTNHFTTLSEPDGEITSAYAGRLIGAKGLDALVAAHSLLAERDRRVRLVIAGERDSASHDSIPEAVVDRWRQLEFVELAGHVDDVRDIWAKAHIAVLASRREGLPMSLLEAAACGRPIVSTDVPGSREIARHGLNALLAPVDDPPALAEAIDRLAGDPDLRMRFGRESRRLAVEEFSSVLVGREAVALYRRLVGEPAAAT